MQAGLDDVWMYTGEMFEVDGVDKAMIAAGIGIDASLLKPRWTAAIGEVIAEATLKVPADGWMSTGGRRGVHTEHLGHLLAQMQVLPRAHPGATW
jgi:ring-1,2-phenylacetyl-CoA epoxidase subunit PaaC